MENVKFYETPQVQSYGVLPEGILCQSGEGSFYYYDEEIDL